MIAEEQDVLKSMIKISHTQAELIINFNHWTHAVGLSKVLRGGRKCRKREELSLS